MQSRRAIPAALRTLASLQGETVTREQAAAHGISRYVVDRLVADGDWQRLARGVFHCLALPPPWTAWAWAGVLVGGDGARLGGLAAGHALGLVHQPPHPVTVLVPGTGRPRVAGPWEFRRDRSERGRPVGDPPRSAVEHCVLDVARELDSEADLVTVISEALHRRLTTTRRLQRALDAQSRHPRRRLLDDVLGDVAVGVRSPLERRYLHDVERAHGLPSGQRQVRRRGTETDVLYELHATVVELDGRLHDGARRFRDLTRDNLATADGLATLRYGHHDVAGRPCHVAHQVASVLTDRGWTGLLRPCPRCRRLPREQRGRFGGRTPPV